MLQTMAYGGSLGTTLFENVSRSTFRYWTNADPDASGLCFLSLSSRAIWVSTNADQMCSTSLTRLQIRRLGAFAVILRFRGPRRLLGCDSLRL